LSSGQPAERGAGYRGEAQPVQERFRGEGMGVEGSEKTQPLPSAHPGGHAAALRHDPDPWPKRGRVADRVEAEDTDPARVCVPEPFTDFDRRGLARTVGAEERGDRAAGSGERQARYGSDRTVALDQVGDLDGRGVHGEESTAGGAGGVPDCDIRAETAQECFML